MSDESLSLNELERRLVRRVRSRNADKHRLLVELAEFDRRGGWIAKGATSCAAWWADVCGVEVSTAREQVRVALAMEQLPALSEAMADGRLSYTKVRVISRLAEADTVDELVELAMPCAAGRLGVLLAAWRQARSDEGDISSAQWEARSMSWRTEPDGLVTFTARLRPKEAGDLQAAIEAEVLRSRAPAGATLVQSRADALAMLAASGTSGRSTHSILGRHEVVVHVATNEEGRLVAALEDGTPVPSPQLGEILCESTVRALLHDAKGAPIDASPLAKAPSKRQMRLLEARDKCCQFDGCTARSFLHAHHVIYRAHGGPTRLVNLVLLCSFHHRLVHERDDSAEAWPKAA